MLLLPCRNIFWYSFYRFHAAVLSQERHFQRHLETREQVLSVMNITVIFIVRLAIFCTTQRASSFGELSKRGEEDRRDGS